MSANLKILGNPKSNNVCDISIYSKGQGSAQWCQLKLKAI
ncbi:hypothetical protein FDUTEX481_09126 [Tolypothrix sp. PCC 7601]|nr:hypothetical protein FDUTEX481_09126 [Tolypothrix sp. PCC 7601]